ncbi:hypothetical protein [Streptomyces sp. NEAU-W12]|uniref:hypothetical protein n=1 Tax=Streptomyces sp. NEAU-W12 TaxID=2994668 RepID=UPI00224A554F|nr:hypothetical protein [Streptomyces sp. NEAU-W12]MCX2927556.1 hypothetical protein [Streptomyces sp. NEAU-W12]
MPSTVGILTRLEAAQVRIGCVFSPDRTWAFMLFLAHDAGPVLACTGVRQAER